MAKHRLRSSIGFSLAKTPRRSDRRMSMAQPHRRFAELAIGGRKNP
jgi:hypothetical protein